MVIRRAASSLIISAFWLLSLYSRSLFAGRPLFHAKHNLSKWRILNPLTRLFESSDVGLFLRFLYPTSNESYVAFQREEFSIFYKTVRIFRWAHRRCFLPHTLRKSGWQNGKERSFDLWKGLILTSLIFYH